MCFHENSTYNWVIFIFYFKLNSFGLTKNELLSGFGHQVFCCFLGVMTMNVPLSKWDQYHFPCVHSPIFVTFLLAYTNENSSTSVRYVALRLSGKDSRLEVTIKLYIAEDGCWIILLPLPIKYFWTYKIRLLALLCIPLNKKDLAIDFASLFLLSFILIAVFCSLPGASLAL